MNIQPKVSIVIPVYNGSNYLREAIDSALAQTYPNIEIVVVNDGSRDEGATERVALSYGDKIRYFSKENGGVASALNRAIAEMSGDYFSWLSHDDLYVRDKIEKEVNALTRIGRDDVVIYSDHSTFESNPEEATPVRLEGVPPEHFRYWLTVENKLHGCTLLIPRHAFDKVGVFDESLRVTQDGDLFFRMAKEFPFIHIPELLVKVRIHPNQGNRTMAGIGWIELNQLVINFVRELDPQEMMDATGKSLAESYAKIAFHMYNWGLNEAGALAEQLARQHGMTATLIKIRYLGTRLFIMTRKFLPMNIKHRIKAGMSFVMHWQDDNNMNFLRSSGISRRLSAIRRRLRYFFPILSQSFNKIESSLRGKNGLEIGGPSQVFSTGDIFPIYPIAGNLDNCNFRATTVWEGVISEGQTFRFDRNKPPGRQYIAEATSMECIPSDHYDFVLSSHVLEHSANSILALSEWLRVLKEQGVLVLLLPHKDGTFDHKRLVTTLQHMKADFEMAISEGDLTHLPEIMEFHDLARDPGAGDLAAFKLRSARNIENRCLHHHVFDTPLAVSLVDHMGLQILSVEAIMPMHILIVAQKMKKGEVTDNTIYFGITAAYLHGSPFASDHLN